MKNPVHLLAYEDNLWDSVAQQLIACNRERLPDVTHCHIFVSDISHAPALRRALVEAAGSSGFDALLGPAISTLEIWLNNEYPATSSILNLAAQELILVEEIRQSKALFNIDEPWALTSELLRLFDELTRANCKPDVDLAVFQKRLAQFYQLDDNQSSLFQKESRIVYTLWKAWHAQLQADNTLDAASAESAQLQQSLVDMDHSQSFWLAGLTCLTEARAAWLQQLLKRDNTHLFLHGNTTDTERYHPDAPICKILKQLDISVPQSTPASDYSHCLDSIFSPNIVTITQRSAQFVHAVPEDPFLNRLSLFEADNPEQEAKALDIQIRSWLLEGKQSIGVITEDRRLARRLRALLERGGVNLVDDGGWALSTTSAAAVIERWLETVEQDFAYVPLLDTLKSPFVCLDEDREHHLQTVHRLETDIITHENIASGLGRYKKHLRKRASRLIDAGIWIEAQRKTTENLLLQLEQAADPFTALLKGEHDITLYTDALLNSLESLGTGKRLEADAAGQRILQELETLHKTASEYTIPLSWQEFRGWLGQTLERYTYKTPGQVGPVHLVSLAQGRSKRYSAVVIAGCTAESMPGANHSYAFFNQSVRSELGLQTHSEKLSLKLHDFRHALEAAPEILISYPTMKESDPVIPSPWLTAIKTFHGLCYQGTLVHPSLHHLVNEPTAFVRKDMAALPDRQSAHPAAALPEQLVPKRWSASMHQNLIDCPYKFFAANGLKLQAREEVRLALAKADYGSLVHRILHAFHGGIDGLPGPWEGAMTELDRSTAEQLLGAISNAVFSTATRDNFHARVWLQTWQHAIPLYIGWQLKHGNCWKIDKTEQQLEIPITNNRSCYGRVDRIDKNSDNQHCVLDYKTGALPKKDDVLSGEAVQLPTYALLSENDTTEIAYVQIDKKKVSTAVRISDEAIQPLLLETRERLFLLTNRISQQENLTAWGDSKVCQYCNIDVICRRESWTESDE